VSDRPDFNQLREGESVETFTEELVRRECRAQGGIIQFAEEMQAIRDGNLYLNAKETHGGKLEPWASYCKERWGMSKNAVDQTVLALPVLKRFGSHGGAVRAMPSVSAAATVATLPEPVQNIILGEHTWIEDDKPKRDDVRAKAKAARAVGEAHGTIEEMIEAAMKTVATPPKKRQKPKYESAFTSAIGNAHFEVERAANIASSTPLTDEESYSGWHFIQKMKYEISRLEDSGQVARPDVLKPDLDDQFAEILS